jgi:hypothetical protein
VGGVCSTHTKDEKFIQDFSEKAEGEKSLVYRCGWEDNIKM